MRRALVALAVLASALVGPPAEAVTTHSCGGTAPTSTACQTGTWTRGTTISHDVAADLLYAGTVETVLKHAGGSRVFRCTYSQALRRACVAFGPFPAENASFTHRCRSLVPGSAVEPPPHPLLSGVEGGAGAWSCSVTV